MAQKIVAVDAASDDPALAGLLEKFAQAPAVWFASTRPGGRAHLAPIWHVWHGGRAYVVTEPGAVRARNIAAHPDVSLALPDPMDALIVEGRARLAPEMVDELQPLFFAKYDWDIRTDADYTAIVEITPAKVMAWGGHGEGRWRFAAVE